jgi:hypothetical protein
MDNDPQYRTGDGSALRIWRDATKNTYQSEQQGRPVFDDVTYVEVITPGSRGSTPVFEVKRFLEADKERKDPLLGSHYEQFKEFVEDFEKGEEADKTLVGTPLKEWPEISRTLAAALRAANIYSVDALAELPDEKLSSVGPDGRTWRTKAQAFLAAAKDSSVATMYAAQVEDMRIALADRDDQVKALAAQIDELQRKLGGDPPAAVLGATGKGKAGEGFKDKDII